MTYNNINKLNLGCDFDYKEGWINLDQYPGRADIVHNLNNFPWPFKDNTFDYILANHVIEHLNDIPSVMKELWRISKNGATIRIVVPYFNHFNAYRDPTHVQFFTWDTFSMFVDDPKEIKVGYLDKLFTYKKKRLIWGETKNPILKSICLFMNWFVNLNPRFIESRIPFLIATEALLVELYVKK